jgi:hypothetical protein
MVAEETAEVVEAAAVEAVAADVIASDESRGGSAYVFVSFICFRQAGNNNRYQQRAECAAEG